MKFSDELVCALASIDCVIVFTLVRQDDESRAVGAVVKRNAFRIGSEAGAVNLVGRGTRIEDVLFTWKVTGHFRYF